MSDQIRQGLQHLADHVSMTGPEFARAMKSPMLLDGLRSRGYVNERGGRVAVSERGQKALADRTVR